MDLNDMITGGINSIGEYVKALQASPSIPKKTFREKAYNIQPEQQPEIQPESEPEVQPKPEQPVPTQVLEDEYDAQVFNSDYEYDFEAEDTEPDTVIFDENMQQKQEHRVGSLKISKEASRVSFNRFVQDYENPRELGLQGNIFKPIKSSEGTGTDTNNSEYEIGYGIKVKKAWLTDNRTAWPKINGVSVDVRKGITKEQAEDWSLDYQDKAVASAKTFIGGTAWSKMNEMEKMYWSDLAYNLGNAGVKKNIRAKKAIDKGYTLEGILKSLDCIKVNKKASKGLLNRRLSMYNKASMEIEGAPVIVSYKFGTGISVRFGSDFMTNKVSKRFAKDIKNMHGWMPVLSNTTYTEANFFKETDAEFEYMFK